MRGWVFGLAAMFASSLGAIASAAPSVITQPDWIEKPQADDLDEAYPEIAQVLGIEGFAVLDCRVDAFGRLEGCKAVDETPAGLGFGMAIVSMAPLFRMRPMAVDGAPVDGGDIRIPVRFRLPTPSPVAALPARADPLALDLARRFIDLTQLTQTFARAHDEKADELEFTEAEDLSPEVRGDAAAALRAAAKAHLADMREALAGVSLTLFSPAELQEIVSAMGPARAVLAPDAKRDAVFEMLRREMVREVQAAAGDAFCLKQACDVAQVLQSPVDAVIQAPVWVEAPAEADVEGARSGIAQSMGLPGAVRLRCKVTALARVESCQAVAEAPLGLGFAQSATLLTARLRLAPKLMALGAENESVAVTVSFDAPQPPQIFHAPQPRSAKALALAQQMVASGSGADRAKTEEEMAASLRSPPDGVDRAAYSDAVTALRDATRKAAVSFADGSARTLAALYTEDQLAAAAAFKRSAASRILAERLPRMAAAADSWGEAVEVRIQADARATFCKAHDCVVVWPSPASPAR